MRVIPGRMTSLRWRAFLCAVLLTMGMILPAAGAQSYPFVSSTNDKVNMRRSASASSVVLERLEKGQEVRVLGESGKYYRVSYNERTGYILKQYVGAAATAAATTSKTSTAGTASGYPYQTTTKDSVNMRRSASSSAVILERIPKGGEITVSGEQGDYLKIIYNNRTGYVLAEFVYTRTVATSTPKATATPTPAPDASDYITLQKGSTGTEVRALQQALIELGFLSGTVDGSYGTKTVAAVEAFQDKNRLTETGVADGSLQLLMYEGKPLNAKGKAVTVMTLPPIDGITIRLGNMGDAVTSLQEKLTSLGYFTGTVDGICGSGTVAAIKAFQKKNGLSADGAAGSATLAKLSSSSALGADEDPTPTPGATAPGGSVREGDESAAAGVIQKRLKELKYFTGTVDGKFGKASVGALKAFQKMNGLTQDGVAGSQTQAVLFSSSAVPATGKPTPSPTPTATPMTEDNVVVIHSGTKGVPVLNLQKRLTELGYYTARMDGNYLATDIAAVKAFQKNNGLKSDGIAGYETQVILYSSQAKAASGVTPTPTPTPTATPDLSTLRQGSTGNQVKSLQQRLIQLGYLTGTADGTYGTATYNAVAAFQKANGLTKDGVAGKTTLDKLYSTSAVAAVTPTPAPTATPASLRQGDASEAVKAMQTMLISLGYLKGKADGKFGVNTLLALKAFQLANGLKADGVAGSSTLAKLNSSSAKPAPTVPGATATPKPTSPPVSSAPKASQVRYANWYTEIRARCKLYPNVTIYDFSTGLSWKLHMFSLGAHADSEPVTAEDTAIMRKAFGGTTWTAKAVWVIFSDGRVYMGSTHDTPHGVEHNTTNNFPGHLCIHFPRTAAEVAAIGPYATSHQAAIDAGWRITQSMIK